MMNSIKIILSGFSVSMRQWRVAAIVYFIQLCLALTLGMQVFDVLQASIGHSLEINKLLAQYDHTVLTDFLKVHGASITPLIGQLRWLLLAWLLFSVFLNAGLLFCVSTKPESKKSVTQAFWLGGATYFFPFLKINLIFLLLALAWAAMICLPLAAFFEPSLQYFSSEKYFVWIAMALLMVFLTGLAVLFIWSVISRLLKIKTGTTVPKNVKHAWQILWVNKRGFVGLLTGFVGLQIMLIIAYWLIEAFTGMTSAALILLLFIVQQVFVFLRIQLRQMMYASVERLL